MKTKTDAAKIWKAAVYLRLSKDDGDSVESESIANQRDLINYFVKSCFDVQIVEEYIDDGFTGVNFERPSFQRMLNDMKSEKIDCLIVKDLSRFARNMTGAGKYIDNIFPFLGVRFIAVNDNVDTAAKRSANDYLIIPVKNMINENHPRQTSINVKSHLEIKRRNGMYVGNFCPYGYKKCMDNHNKIEIDDKAAVVVRDIFSMRINGYSNQRIANYLNEQGISSPLAYKQQNAENFRTPFQTYRVSKWTAKAISRVIENEIYIGNLVQGKVTTPNFKVKKRIDKTADEWIRVEDTHEPIIDNTSFKIANNLKLIDTRTAPNEKSLYLFSGYLYCADCNQSIIRKTVPSKDKKYVYYVCSQNKNEKTCTSHSISETKLTTAVLKALRKHVSTVLSAENILNLVAEIPYKQFETQKIENQLLKKRLESEKLNNKRFMLYDDYKNEIITKAEYTIYKKSYDDDFDTVICEINLLEKELAKIINSQNNSEWIEEYRACAKLEYLTRKTIVSLINRIVVHENNSIDISFKYQYYFENALKYLNENNIFKEVCVNG